MTQPTDPYANDGLTEKQRAAQFAESLKLGSYQDFGSKYRPGLANALASGTATPDDITSITSFVRALDAAKQARANQLASIGMEHSAEAQDLLNSVGEGQAIVKRANATAQNTKDPAGTSHWFDNVGHTVASYSANSGDLIFPQTAGFSGKGSTPDGSPENPITHGIKVGLNTIGNFAGWLYRGTTDLSHRTYVGLERATGHMSQAEADQAADKLGLTQQASAERALGYDPNSLSSDLAFQWNHGEAAFNDLSSVEQQYGKSAVDDALAVFYSMKGYGSDFNTALGQYVQDLGQQVQDGKLTPDQYVAKQKFLDSKEFQDAYRAVDMQHKSFGRDLAHMILPHQAYDDPNDATLFNAISGVGDAALALVADPTIVGGKILKSAQIARYGVDALNSTKVSRLLGVVDPVTGQANKATRLGTRVQGFLDSAKKVRDLTAAGDHVGAAAEHARMSHVYNDLMPTLGEVNGDRLAITAEQKAASKEAGTTASMYGRAELPTYKGDTIETLDQFRDFLTAQGGLNRFARGVGAGTLRMMPGKVGIISRTLAKAAGERAASRVAAKSGVVLDYVKDIDKINPSDWSDLFQQIAQARGTEQFDALQGQLGVARKLRARAEQMNRRVTSLLPIAKTISFNALDSGADIERLARLSLPKYEASILRYIWDTTTTEATRRAVGRGIVHAVHEAAGTTRSVVGRAALDAWDRGQDTLGSRAYGLGETDRLVRADGSIGRAALHMSQIETNLTLPQFENIRRLAAKAAIFGYDARAADGTLAEGMAGWLTDAAGNRAVGSGIGHMARHPWRTAKYSLFFSAPVEKAMAVLKIGWLLTSSNMLRQMAEEYLGIGAAGNRYRILDGKRYLRLNNDTNRFLVMAHNHIPSFRRRFVVDESDAAREIAASRYRVAMGDGDTSEIEKTALAELAEVHTHPEVLEMYGARQAGMADGIDVAVAGHADGVQHAPLNWNGKGKLPKRQVVGNPARFKGYVEDELNGDSGRAALSDMYGQRFHDEDEPALRALAYHMWNQAAKDPKFLEKLDDKTLAKMEELYPPERSADTSFARIWGDAAHTNPEVEHHAQQVYESKSGKLQLVKYDLKGGGTREEQPLKYIYRVVSKDDYERMKAAGTLDTDGRGAHGRYDPDTGEDLGPLMFGAVVPTKIAKTYGAKDDGAVLLKIKYRIKDGWTKDTSAGEGQAVVSTRKAIPWSQVADAAPYRVVGDVGDTKLVGTDGKLLGASKDHLIDYVANSEKTATFRQRAEHLNTDEQGHVIAPADAQGKAEAVERYVDNLLGDTAAAVFNREGKSMHVPLVSDLLHSKIPSPEELHKLSLSNLPAHVIRAEFEPAPLGRIGQFGEGITQVLSGAFDKVVTAPMYRLIRKPLFTANYVRARVSLAPWEKQLVEEFGWAPEEAKKMVSGLAEGQALQDTIKYIDNPAMRSQFSVIAQNVWLFYRAQEDWARRWVRILKEDPEAIRKAHMAIMAGSQIGMIDKDSDGNLIFSYPGSGLALEAAMHVGAALGLGGGAKVPHVDDLTSQVNWLNPALMNPFGFSATPALSVPFDLLAKFIPGGEMLKSSADMAMQGQQGNSRAIWEQFMPTAIRRLIQLTAIDGSPDNTASTVGSSAASAMQNAALLGQLPDDTSDAVKMQQFITNTQTQTLNSLIARSVFSFFAPGAPSMPELYGEEPADFTWRAAGVRTLSDEYKAMVQKFGFDNALVMWQELHPDKLIVTVGKTDATAKGASIDPTYPTVEWIAAHKELFQGPYKRVAAYLIPPAPGHFDQTAWNAMMAIGVRQHKDLTEFYTDIVSKNAVTAWFNAEDDYKAASAAAKSGDIASLERQWQKENLTDDRKAQLRQIFSNTENAGLTTQAIDDAWAKKKTDLYAQHPILHTYFAETASRKDDLRQMVNELRNMVEDPKVNLPDMPGVAKMLIVKDNYEKQSAALKGQRSTEATAQRQDLLNSYQDAMNGIVAKYPNLKDMYNGVFRYLEQ